MVIIIKKKDFVYKSFFAAKRLEEKQIFENPSYNDCGSKLSPGMSSRYECSEFQEVFNVNFCSTRNTHT